MVKRSILLASASTQKMTTVNILQTSQCLATFVLSNTTFQKEKHSLPSCFSNDQKTKNQHDNLLIAHRWCSSVLSCSTRKPALTDSDHKPLTSTIKLRLKSFTTRAKTPNHNITSIRSEKCTQEYQPELKKLSKLSPITEKLSIQQAWE